PLICLCIDVSAAAQQKGLLADVCASMLSLLDQLALHPKQLLSIVTYSDAVHYYSITLKQKMPQMHVLRTLEDLFLPAPFGMLIRVSECKPQLQTLFSSLPAYHSSPAPND